MTQAICFQCERELEEIGKSLEELIESRLPVFCSDKCSWDFPDNGTNTFDKKLEELKDGKRRGKE